MHRTVDSIRLPLADMCSIFLMTSGGQKRAVKLGESYMAHRKILTSGSKRKHPNKQAGKSVNRKIHRGRHLVPVHGDLRDTGHTPAHAVLFPIDTLLPYFRTSCVCVCLCVRVSQSVIVSACLFNDLYNWHHSFRICSFLIT